jgi:hypothetical protein
MTPPLLFLSSLLSSSPPAVAQQTTGPEPLLGASLTATGVVFVVRSGGCTRRDDFGLVTTSRKPLTVTLIRIRPDYCKGDLPGGALMKYTYAELGVGPRLDVAARRRIIIQNPVEAPASLVVENKVDADGERGLTQQRRQKNARQRPSESHRASWAGN